MQRLLLPLVATVAVALAGCASDTERAAYAAKVADGQAIAQTRCAGCHAIGNYGESPTRGAPPFRHVLERYNAQSLDTDLVAGIRVAHAMPAFQFDPADADALIAYLRSIRSDAPADEQRHRP